LNIPNITLNISIASCRHVCVHLQHGTAGGQEAALPAVVGETGYW
jgi:hypothetical protein